jgi:hypothetical protein
MASSSLAAFPEVRTAVIDRLVEERLRDFAETLRSFATDGQRAAVQPTPPAAR